MAFNPDAIFMSPSSISDFVKCAQLYYLRNVFRNPKSGLKIQLLNDALALGQVIHDTLEQYLIGEVSDRVEERCWDLYDMIWKTVVSDDGIFDSVKEKEASYERGKHMLRRFLGSDHFKTAVKAEFPSFPKVDVAENLILTGKLDWIEKNGDSYTIVDFKTGKNEEAGDSLQLPIYAFLASHILKIPVEKIVVNYWYIDKDDTWVSFALPDMQEFETRLKQIGKQMKMVRQTKSFKCSRGGESCWACKDMVAISRGEGKLISVDVVSRKQEVYILPKTAPKIETPTDLPF